MVKPRDAICLHMVSLVTDGVTDERRRMPISRNKKSCHVLATDYWNNNGNVICIHQLFGILHSFN